MAYLSKDTFKAYSTVPAADIDAFEIVNPGWLDAQCELISSGTIDSRLRIRYPNLPFQAPYPSKVIEWCVAILTQRYYLRRGCDPADPMLQTIWEAAKTASAELLEAATHATGLFDLPATQGATESAATERSTWCSVDASPYDWLDTQRRNVYG